MMNAERFKILRRNVHGIVNDNEAIDMWTVASELIAAVEEAQDEIATHKRVGQLDLEIKTNYGNQAFQLKEQTANLRKQLAEAKELNKKATIELIKEQEELNVRHEKIEELQAEVEWLRTSLGDEYSGTIND